MLLNDMLPGSNSFRRTFSRALPVEWIFSDPELFVPLWTGFTKLSIHAFSDKSLLG
jgi:hypothetical protein